MTRAARVLYEDKRAEGGPGKEFPLHRLLLCLVADRLGCAGHDLRPCFQEVPRNGVDKVITSLSDFAGTGVPVVAVVDGDRIVRHVAARFSDAGVTTVEAACALLEQRHPGARVVVIPDNVEAVLGALGACDPSVPPDLLARALQHHRSRTERDQVLVRATRQAADSVRRCLLERLPGLSLVVDALEPLALPCVPRSE